MSLTTAAMLPGRSCLVEFAFFATHDVVQSLYHLGRCHVQRLRARCPHSVSVSVSHHHGRWAKSCSFDGDNVSELAARTNVKTDSGLLARTDDPSHPAGEASRGKK